LEDTETIRGYEKELHGRKIRVTTCIACGQATLYALTKDGKDIAPRTCGRLMCGRACLPMESWARKVK
jgi:hypothetical protein